MSAELFAAVVEAAFPGADISLLGRGGFGCTFRVRDGQQDLAVKVLDPDKVEARAGREARALERVSSPYVVELLDVGEQEHDGRPYPYLVMRFVEGRTLAEVVDNGHLSLELVLELAIKLADGLAAIWVAGLVHRDLKPGNVIVGADGAPVIVDLGIARHLDLETVTIPPSPGTPGWMAPEQVDLDQPARGDWRSDQFSFGLLLYVLATGYYPYRGTRYELWQAPRTQDVLRAESVNPAIPSALGDVIRRLMAPEPHRRFLRADRLRADLERAQAAVAAGVASSAPPAGRFHFIQGDLKSFTSPEFYAALDPDGVVCDARSMGSRLAVFVDQARAVNADAAVDPVSYFDRSPQSARQPTYRDLPYGDRDDAVLGFADDDERRAYVEPIVSFQRATNVNVLIAPYFYAARGEIEWVRESLEVARVSEDILAGEGDERPLWTSVAIAQDLLRPQHRDELLNTLTGRLPRTLYLFVHTSQASFAPLNDREVLEGMRTLIETMSEAEVDLVFGRRASEGLLLVSLGAGGFSTGVRALHQNFQPHPDVLEEGGGPGYDWFYVPRFLNSVRMETRRDIVAQGHQELVDCNCSYCGELFATSPAATIATTEDRLLVHRHNIYALRQQTRRLADLAPLDRLQLMGRWIDEALAAYRELPPTWATGEGPDFLTTWRQLL